VPPEALSLMVTVPLRVPATVGVNVTLMVQVLLPAPAAGRVVFALQVEEGSRAKSPLMESPVSVKLLVPVLVRVTD
jgi:hypothetical protein